MLAFGLYSYGKDIIPKAQDILPLACLGLFGMAGMSTFLFFGQQTTTAINSAIIQEVMPVLINILIASFGERLSCHATLWDSLRVFWEHYLSPVPLL